MQSALALSINDVLKDAQRIHEFRGDDSFALTSFLREVDTVLELVQSDLGASEYIYKRIILNKLQGEALHVLRTLGPNPAWSETKRALIENFGVKQSYHQLYQEAFGAKNYGIINYYSHLLSILCKINEKYEYDYEKPVEFSPANAEKIILRTFINNIDVNLASVVINRNVSKLRDAYNLLEHQGLIRNNIQKTYNNNQNFKHANQMHRNDQYTSQNSSQNRGNNFRNSSSGYNNNNQNPNTKVNSQNYSNSQSRPNFSSQTRNLYTQHNSQSYNSNRGGSGQSHRGEMEIDHIEAVVHCPVEEEDVNFHLTASKRHFQ